MALQYKMKQGKGLPRECTSSSKHPLPTARETALHKDIIRWSIQKSDWLYSLQPKMEKLYTVNKSKIGSWLWLWSCILIAKLILKLKKVGKTMRPLRYALSQISYDCTVEVTNRFKGLDLIERLPEELWTEVCDIVQEAVVKTILKKKKWKKAK